MFRKTLLRSMATTAAVGTAMAGAALAAPATVVASGVAPMSCTAYQHTIVTKTTLGLRNRTTQYGTRNVAFVTVTSDAMQPPQGRVRISTPTNTWTVTLDADGFAKHGLGRWLPPGDYTVEAQYLPGCSAFGRSHSPVDGYTVAKAHTDIARLHDRNIASGEHPRVALNVDSSTGSRVHGRVRIQLFHHNRLRRTKVVRLHHGHAVAWFGKVRGHRLWHVTATYLGNRDFGGSQGDTTFWVSR